MNIQEVKPEQSESISHWGMQGLPDAKRALDIPVSKITFVGVSSKAQPGTKLYRQLNSKAFNTQVGGSHYKKLPIQPTEYAMANGLDAAQANIIKYATRFRDKDGARDLKKIVHYVEYLLETEYPGE